MAVRVSLLRVGLKNVAEGLRACENRNRISPGQYRWVRNRSLGWVSFRALPAVWFSSEYCLSHGPREKALAIARTGHMLRSMFVGTQRLLIAVFGGA